MSLTFSTKAGTLNLLQNRLNSATVAPLVFFTVADWQKNSSACMKNIVDE